MSLYNVRFYILAAYAMIAYQEANIKHRIKITHSIRKLIVDAFLQFATFSN